MPVFDTPTSRVHRFQQTRHVVHQCDGRFLRDKQLDDAVVCDHQASVRILYRTGRDLEVKRFLARRDIVLVDLVSRADGHQVVGHGDLVDAFCPCFDVVETVPRGYVPHAHVSVGVAGRHNR